MKKRARNEPGSRHGKTKGLTISAPLVLVVVVFSAPGLSQDEDLEKDFLREEAGMQRDYQDFERAAYEEDRLLSDEKRIAGGIIARQEERHTRCCVILGSPRGELHPGGRLGRGSDRRDKKTKSDVQKLNRRVRQEEGRTPAGVVQQSQWAGGSWE